LIENLLLGRFQFGVGRILEVFDVFLVESRDVSRDRRGGLGAPLQDFQFAQPAFQPLTSAAQRLVNCFRRRRETAL
jgi:hypothetical protein